MKYLALLVIFMVCAGFLHAQQPLPVPTFLLMRDSTTSIDVVFLQGKGGSISVDGRNTHLFNSFFENETAKKGTLPLAGNIMWEMYGREFLSGSFYVGDSTGYVVINHKGKEYVNLINGQGNSFFKQQTGK
ncbi:MAG TPA: hypothetical protein VG603_13645 [Chitinophagales bacterium]|nr:hypothetical protein [Chitinophagales bacterium]